MVRLLSYYTHSLTHSLTPLACLPIITSYRQGATSILITFIPQLRTFPPPPASFSVAI